MVPVIELRGGLPYGIALGLDYPLALTAAVLGNMVPVPFIIVYIRHIFTWLRKRSKWWDGSYRVKWQIYLIDVPQRTTQAEMEG